MKICKKCGKEFVQGNHKRRSCPQCVYKSQKDSQIRWRENNPEKVRSYEISDDRRKRYRQKRKDVIDTYKLERGCKCCGLKSPHPQVYDLHHRDPNEKDFTISSRGFNKSLDKVQEEMAKCEVLCANCHRLVHAGVITA